MSNTKFKHHALAAACLIGLASFSTHAQTLGRLITYSHLNEPLSAMVEINGLDPSSTSLEQIGAKIADAATYQRANLRRPAWADQVAIQVRLIDTNRLAVKLTLPEPVEDPASALILELSVGSQLARKEYALILDPKNPTEPPKPITAKPLNDKKFAAEAKTPPPLPPNPLGTPSDKMAGQPLGPLPEKFNLKDKKPSSIPSNTNNETDRSTGTAESYTTQKGDTLGVIASRQGPKGADINQVMIAFAKKNPKAFIDGNINRLRSGALLVAPTSAEAQALTRAQAASAVREQMQTWSTWRQEAVAGSKVVQSPANASGTTSGSIVAKTPVLPTDDKLKIEESKKNSAAAQIATEKALEEAKSRNAELEKIRTDMAKLLELKNAQLAQVQKDLEEAKKVPPVAKVPDVVPVKPVEAAKMPVVPSTEPTPSTEPAQTGAAVKEPVKDPVPVDPDAPASASASAPAATPAPDAPASAPVVKKPPVIKAKPPVVPPVETPEPGMAGFIQQPAVLAGGSALLLALLGGVFFLLRRKKNKDIDPETISPATIGPGTGSGLIDETRVPDGMGMTPLEEHLQGSDTFLGFGKYDKALYEAQEALAIEPTNPEGVIRALRALVHLQDVVNFDAYYQQMQPHAKSHSALWDNAQDLKAQIDEIRNQQPQSDNWMQEMGQTSLEQFLTEPKPLASDPLSGMRTDEPMPAHTQSPLSSAFAEPMAPTVMEFEINLPTLADEEPVLASQKDEISFDNVPSLNPSEPNESKAQIDAIDLSLPDDKFMAPDIAFEVERDTVSLEPQNWNMDQTPSAAPQAEEEDANLRTMLDLAKAYLDMQDFDATAQLLQEIIKDSNGGPVGREAQQMLDQLKGK